MLCKAKKITARFQWVKAHQDEGTDISTLTPESRLNVWADYLNHEARTLPDIADTSRIRPGQDPVMLCFPGGTVVDGDTFDALKQRVADRLHSSLKVKMRGRRGTEVDMKLCRV